MTNNLKWQESLPKKRMGAGALIFNEQDEILLVKPTYYKDIWTFPGGVVEADESPKQACIREIKEEIGLNINRLEFVCVAHYPATNEKTENLQFVFSAGQLNAKQIKNIKIDGEEISKHKFFKLKDALKLLSPRAAERVQQSLDAIKNNKAIYLE